MICPVCEGHGNLPVVVITSAGRPVVTHRLPCPECGGCGIVSCCDVAGSAQPAPQDTQCQKR